MSYENAPATQMLATHCAVCGRPLLDAESVNLGIGPVCRDKYGYYSDVDPAARAEANQLVHQVALKQKGLEVLAAAARLTAIGFPKLGAIIVDRCASIVITEEAGQILVKTPYNPDVAAAFSRVRSTIRSGSRWDGELKANRFPAKPEAKRAVFEILSRFFAGRAAVGPKGPFIIEAA